MTRGAIYFPPFALDLDSERLREGSRFIALTPKAFAVLRHLVQHPGQLISKEDLLTAFWPDTHVGDAVLKVIVAEIRKALDDSSREPKYIETAHRRGYRFIGAINHSPVQAQDFKGLSRALAIGLPKPETHYAHSGDVSIAYQTLGQGPLDLVFVMGWVSHLEYFWTEPSFARFLHRLASFSRLILFDKRGTGLSDRVPISQLPTLEQRMDDVRAVLEAIGSERAALCGVSEGGPMSALFAATYPEKTSALVMIGTYARRIWDTDHPWGATREEFHRFITEIQDHWGGPVGLEERAPSMASDPDFREWWATYLRMGASPGAAVALTRMNAEIDVRHVLATIRVPTLVLHRTGDRCFEVEEGRFVASRIPGARFVELPGSDHLPFVGDTDRILTQIEEFVTGVRPDLEPDRVLATVLTGEFRESTAAAPSEQWRQLSVQLGSELGRFRGRALEQDHGSILASFDGPARAARCAQSLAGHALRHGVGFRAGLHTGECDYLPDGRLGGVSIDVAAEICGRARWGEVLASGTVRDLLAGSGIPLEPYSSLVRADLGAEWPLFRLHQ